MKANLIVLLLEFTTIWQEAAWVISNLAASSVEHKRLIYASEATPLLINFLLSAPFDVRKEAAYALGNLCVAPTETIGHSNIILDHLVSIVHQGCLPGIINLLKSPDMESARLGLQFLELVREFIYPYSVLYPSPFCGFFYRIYFKDESQKWPPKMGTIFYFDP